MSCENCEMVSGKCFDVGCKKDSEAKKYLQDIANKISEHTPDGFVISLHIENGAAWVELAKDNKSDAVKLPDAADKTLFEQLNDALCVANGFGEVDG